MTEFSKTKPVHSPRPKSLAVVETEPDLRGILDSVRQKGQRIGLVPTMGALHAGHLRLIETARQECDYVVVSIFVNPTQFGPGEDFERYPRPLQEDLNCCREAGVDLVFHPARETMYTPGFQTYVEVEGVSALWEGAFRPSHFRGVATIVLKLFLLTQPHVAYFGLKDYQQQVLVKTMCRDLHVPVEIRTCPIVRDSDGLAVSSRNQYLSREERQSALALSQSLKLAEEHLQAGETDLSRLRKQMQEHLESKPGVTVDYATVVHPETLEELAQPQPEMVALVAARVGGTRLIDNRIIHLQKR